MSARCRTSFQALFRSVLENARLVRAVGLTLALFTFGAVDAEASRLVRASVSVDGKVVLKSSYGDNGSPDADEVWDQLKSLTFAPTEEFASLGLAEGAREATLESNVPVGTFGQIYVDIAFGGTGQTRHLRLIRVEKDQNGRLWRIHPEDIDDLFDERMIRRDQAALLKKVMDSEARRDRASKGK